MSCGSSRSVQVAEMDDLVPRVASVEASVKQLTQRANEVSRTIEEAAKHDDEFAKAITTKMDTLGEMLQKATDQNDSRLDHVFHAAETSYNIANDSIDRVQGVEDEVDDLKKLLIEYEHRLTMSTLCIALSAATWASIVASSWIYILNK